LPAYAYLTFRNRRMPDGDYKTHDPRKPRKCPDCGAKPVPSILGGMPSLSDEPMKKEARGESELATRRLRTLLTARYGSVGEAKNRLGKLPDIKAAFRKMQAELYSS